MKRILLIKPYQPCENFAVAPPLGLLYLVSNLRQRLGERIEIDFIDAKLHRKPAVRLEDRIAAADVIGLSALNFEAPACLEIAKLAKRIDPTKRVVLGGPYAHLRAAEILGAHDAFDWVFDGEADRTFPEAVERYLDGADFTDIKGMFYRREGSIVAPPGNDSISNLDELPLPAWDLAEFDRYARNPNMNMLLRGKRYATLFTSRGCPYLCAYCHDIFTKRFRWRSPENVLAEMTLLIEQYGIDEFQIVDDIFNLHKPRLKAIFAGLAERHGDRRLKFCFPNGLRGDILDEEVIEVMRRAGAYEITLAIETVTPRLQGLIQKYLKLEKVEGFINHCHKHGILVNGFFMLGFPTETREELWNTIRFAWRSKLTIASFFTVVPQPGTPLYLQAQEQGPEALALLAENGYYTPRGWYELATGYPLARAQKLAVLGFYFTPSRFVRLIFRVVPSLPPVIVWHMVVKAFSILLSIDIFSLLPRLRARVARRGAAGAIPAATTTQSV